MAISIIVSGFGPWGEVDENPTALVLEQLAERDRLLLHLPVDTAAASRCVEDALDRHRPTVWLGLGLAVGAAAIAVERVALNLRDFREPDVAGAQPRATAIVEGAPPAYLATIPVDAIVAALKAAGIPAQASTSAGTFLCNQLMFEVLHGAARRSLPLRAGFLHVPAHPALVARATGRLATQPSMSLELIASAVRHTLTMIGR